MTKYLFALLFIYGCITSHNTVNYGNKPMSDIHYDSQPMSLGQRDTATYRIDGSGDGIFGRKIVYRSLRAITTGFNVNGTIGFIICINRDGIVDYTSLIENESTITNPKVRLAYLKASKEYKFELDPTAPKQQCGKIKFRIDNSVKRSR